MSRQRINTTIDVVDVTHEPNKAGWVMLEVFIDGYDELQKINVDRDLVEDDLVPMEGDAVTLNPHKTYEDSWVLDSKSEFITGKAPDLTPSRRRGSSDGGSSNKSSRRSSNKSSAGSGKSGQSSSKTRPRGSSGASTSKSDNFDPKDGFNRNIRLQSILKQFNLIDYADPAEMMDDVFLINELIEDYIIDGQG